MANEEQLALLKQGVDGWNEWRHENNSIEPDLIGADLDGAKLFGADLDGAKLFGAKLFGAKLIGADLIGADLFAAHLSEADLRGADLCGAHLNWADLRGADLRGADLRGADLNGADLREAHLNRANLREADLSEADLTRADLSEADLTRADLAGVRLIGAQLIEADLTNADLTGCHIYGVSAWNLKLEGATQSNLVITPPDEPVITVDDLEIAQFIYLLLNYKKFRNVINSVTERGVLILGRFGGGGLDVLHSVATKLREEQYLPIIFDFDRPTDRNYTETVITLVGLARFVIVDLSGPSVPQELYATVPHFNVPFVPILEGARRPYATFRDFFEKDWVIKPPVYFSSIKDLMEKIPGKIIAPAEKKLKKRQALLDRVFRSKNK